MTDEATGFDETRESYARLSRMLGPFREARERIVAVFGDNIVEYHGVNVTFRDALELDRDQFLYGTAYVLVDGPTGRRLPPTQVVSIDATKETPVTILYLEAGVAVLGLLAGVALLAYAVRQSLSLPVA